MLPSRVWPSRPARSGPVRGRERATPMQSWLVLASCTQQCPHHASICFTHGRQLTADPNVGLLCWCGWCSWVLGVALLGAGGRPAGVNRRSSATLGQFSPRVVLPELWSGPSFNRAKLEYSHAGLASSAEQMVCTFAWSSSPAVYSQSWACSVSRCSACGDGGARRPEPGGRQNRQN